MFTEKVQGQHTAPAPIPLGVFPLQGSHGTPTLKLRPLFSSDTVWGSRNALSLSRRRKKHVASFKAKNTRTRPPY